MMVRSQAADYGFQLNEFDPFFNFRATEFLVNNGLAEYYAWHDDMSWHPSGRDVSATSQVMLHVTAAATYKIFGANVPLYDFTILFPVVMGSLTAIVVFALGRLVGGTTTGLFAALLYSVSLPVAVRGTIGWFKSEPLGLFYGLLGVYLFLSGIHSTNKKVAVSKIIGGGIILAFGLSSWGGIVFFIIPLGLFFVALPFLRSDSRFLMWAVPLFVASLLLTVLTFERPGLNFLVGIEGTAMIASSSFLVAAYFLHRFIRKEKRLQYTGLFLAGFVVASFVILGVTEKEEGILDLPAFRYLNAMNPFLTTSEPLVDSVSEHATTTLRSSFFFNSVLMIFAGFAIWYLIKKKDEDQRFNIKNDLMVFSLILGLAGVYTASAFIRLELFASISVILLGSIGLCVLVKQFLLPQGIKTPKRITRIIFLGVIAMFLLVPIMLPTDSNWVKAVKGPPTILNGGSNYNVATNDWLDAMGYIKENTPQDSVVAAWWDYGYWISTLGERTSLADNATLITSRIQMIAQMFLSQPDEAHKILQELDADYVLVYVAGQKVSDSGAQQDLYLLNGGGDESKKQWFIRIAEEPLSRYLQQDGTSGTDLFWNETVLGKMFPFSVIAYVNPNTNQQSASYQPGFIPVYVKDIKYPPGGDGPLELVYASPSFEESRSVLIGVFIYKVNEDYAP
ncbi:MAG: hypothetical protein GWN01_10925 [Nitrosopumilaceae archaeon]|nr:hypothetical protein [Nitrosopumilaceae archaeon]NIU01399.1 hypothetical protein [Nitrosopumilaceae archaeon]NIU87757.1 hypothetical protein [Nitrosopumilaceae archaeon]NIV66135.1 hypothetical protein [Nitrosopumilaceae archaeon]NIX62001.1 hypothetical protein [Nitrosopumilaceae archaeon]